MNKVFFLVAAIWFAGSAMAQPQIIDEIVAVVGDKIILQSDLELQALQAAQQGYIGEDVKCQLLDQMLTAKMFVIQAELDSILVDPSEVDNELDRRIDYYVNLFGSTQAFEDFYGKSIIQIKEEFRRDIEQQILAERMQAKISGDVKVTPSEVKEFFNSIPGDSLPFIDAQVEVGQLVIYAKVSEEQKEYAQEKLKGYKEKIDDGTRTFEYIADTYSEDEAALKGGVIGTFQRGERSKEFDAVAWNLHPGEISEIVYTEDGYELIKMSERMGNKATFQHILIKAKISDDDLFASFMKCDSIRNLINSDKITFTKAVYDFSEDKNTKNSGGMYLNPQSGSSKIEITALKEFDPMLVFMLDTLKVGNISSPSAYQESESKQGSRLVYLKTKTNAHVLNLDDDYDRIQEVSLQNKKQEAMIEWLVDKIAKTYIRIEPKYQSCEIIQYWMDYNKNLPKND